MLWNSIHGTKSVELHIFNAFASFISGRHASRISFWEGLKPKIWGLATQNYGYEAFNFSHPTFIQDFLFQKFYNWKLILIPPQSSCIQNCSLYQKAKIVLYLLFPTDAHKNKNSQFLFSNPQSMCKKYESGKYSVKFSVKSFCKIDHIVQSDFFTKN